MRLVAVSDTHNRFYPHEVPNGDVFIHAGDAIQAFKVRDLVEHDRELFKFAGELKTLSHRHRIFVPGNHDRPFEREFGFASSFFPGVHVLHDSGIVIDGVRFWGSAWTPEYGPWSFMCERGEDIARHWRCIPEDTEVLITHGPPMGILDTVGRPYERRGLSGETRRGLRLEHVGCEELRKVIFSGRLPKLRVSIHGHLHDEVYDDRVIRNHGVHEENGIRFYNVSSAVLNRSHRDVAANTPVVIDL